MLKLKIDNREVEVPAGATILDAAAKLGIEIPTLCFLPGRQPTTSCLVCLVKTGPGDRLVPACATRAAEGMEVASETAEVHAARRSALELLLSDHLGDCLAPCWSGCPAHMDIPEMLRQIAAGDMRGAIATVKADIALPAVLGRICPAPCEKVCRRTGLDGAVSICQLKRCVADVDLASAAPYLPACLPATGRRVAIVGGGPTGLAAAYYLARHGHACTIFEAADRLGGRLLSETTPVEEKGDSPHLPERPEGCFAQMGTVPFFQVLEAEIAQITRLGIEVRLGCGDVAPAELRKTFDAVLVATGAGAAAQAADWGLKAGPLGLTVDKRTFASEVPGVFAAGNAIRGRGMVVRSVADGKEASASIHQFLSGQAVTGPPHPFSTRIGRMEPNELVQLAAPVGKAPRAEIYPKKGDTTAEGDSPIFVERKLGQSAAAAVAAEQAARCLHCDCRGLNSCKLRKYAALYGADPRRFQGQRRPFQQDVQHADVVFEPGKCIDCGLCVQITAESGEQLGLTYIGRGFDVRIAVPLGHGLAEALTKVAAECVAACPTAALAWKKPK